MSEPMTANTPVSPLMQRLHDYIGSYEFRGDTDYRPNEQERLLIEDALHGWIAEEEALTRPPPVGGEREALDLALTRLQQTVLSTSGTKADADRRAALQEVIALARSTPTARTEGRQGDPSVWIDHPDFQTPSPAPPPTGDVTALRTRLNTWAHSQLLEDGLGEWTKERRELLIADLQAAYAALARPMVTEDDLEWLVDHVSALRDPFAIAPHGDEYNARIDRILSALSPPQEGDNA